MRQRGFTLIEMVVVTGILGLLLPVLAASIRQLTIQTDRNSTRITAITPLEDGARWLGRDIPLAQETTLVSGDPATFWMFLYWTDWGDKTQYDTYSQTSAVYRRHWLYYHATFNGDLLREYRVCDNWDITIPPTLANLTTAAGCNVSWRWVSTNTVSRYLVGNLFSRNDKLFTVNLNAYPKGTGFSGESRTYRFYATLLGTTGPI